MTKQIQLFIFLKQFLIVSMERVWLMLICFMFPLLTQAQGEVTFTASSDAKQVVLGGYFEISFILENANGGNFKPPPFNKFTVLSGPSQSMSTTSVNGQWSRCLLYTSPSPRD